MPSKTKVKPINDKLDNRTEFLGDISDLGNGIILDQNLRVMTDANGLPIAINLMNSEQYGNLDTHGLSNIGDYPYKEDVVKEGELIYQDPITQQPKRVDIRKPYVIDEVDNGLLVRSAEEGKTISKDEFIDRAITSKPRTLRAPKFLVLDENTPSNVAEAMIQKTYEEIAMNNLDKKRADTLNIVTVPKEQWEKMAIKGEVEKEIFGKYGYPSQRYDLSAQAKLLWDYKMGNITKQQLNDQLELPKSMVIAHPFDKELVDKKLVPKEVDVMGLDYDLLTDPDQNIENDPNVIGIYNIDNHKLVIRNAKAEIKSKKGKARKLDLTQSSGFNDPDVLNIILGFQPTFYSSQYPSLPKRLDQGVQRTQGLASTRVGTESSNMPSPRPSSELESLVQNSPELQQWKQNNPKEFEAYMKDLEKFEDNTTRINPVQCVQGAIPIIRKASIDAWGMTPKQFKCTKDIVQDRMDHVASKSDEIKQRMVGQGKDVSTISDDEWRKLAVDELDTDPQFKSIVGCDSQEELETILGIDNYNQKIDQMITSDIIANDPDLQGKNQDVIDKVIAEKLKAMDKDDRKRYTKKKSYFLVPMRFPTERAMGDTIYCRSISNISPHSIKAREKGIGEIEEEMGSLEELAFAEELTPKQLEMIKSTNAIDVSFKRNTLRKKNVLLLRDSAKEQTAQDMLDALNAVEQGEAENPQKIKYDQDQLRSKVKSKKH